MATEMVVAGQQQFDRRQIEIMRRTVAAGTTPEDFALFLEVCKHRKLNPFNREIYAIVRDNRMTIQVSIDGLRLLAERSGRYRGQLGPYFCGTDGVWREEWLSDAPPVAAKVGILRSDFDQPMWAIARYKSYVQMKSGGEPTTMWRKMPDVLLAKCAEALCFRKTFPGEIAGLYTHEGMAQADTVDHVPGPAVDVSVVQAQAVDAIDTPAEQEASTGQDQEAPATEQQLASIRKLCQHLGKPEPEHQEAMTYLNAKELIAGLSLEYRQSRTKQADPSRFQQVETLLDQVKDFMPADWCRDPRWKSTILRKAFDIPPDGMLPKGDDYTDDHVRRVELEVARLKSKTTKKAS